MRLVNFLAVVGAALVLNGCGGGGGGSSSSTAATTTPVVSTPPAPATCGSASTSTTAVNVASICVSSGPTGAIANLVLVTVTVCAPGSTTNCATIPNVQVDTGSSGLRLFHSQVSSLGLPPQLVGNGDTYYECAGFADGVVWGSVGTADISISGEKASAVPVEVILDDVTTPAVPTDCTNQGGGSENTPSAIGANGIVGVGLFVQDCGVAGSQASTFTDNGATVAQYYDCTALGVCTPQVITTNQQVANPVASFPVDNNGVVLQIPAIPDTGYSSVAANLVFGINTRTNNQLGSNTVIAVPDVSTSASNAGEFTVLYKSTTFSQSFIDSGSSAYFFNDSTIPACPQSSNAKYYLCPGSASALSLITTPITITASNNATVASEVQVANAQFLFNQATAATLFAFDDLLAPAGSVLPQAFDLGLPFFFGKSIYTGLESSTTPAGPFFAIGALP